MREFESFNQEELDYQAQAGQVKGALKDLCSELKTFASEDVDIYVFGSFGRRLAAVSVGDLDGYFSRVDIDKKLRPRKNFRGNIDIDIALPDNQIDWPVLARLAGQITKERKGIEIDPHLLEGVCDLGFLDKSFLVKNKVIDKRVGSSFKFSYFPVLVEEDLPSLKPLALKSQLDYLTQCGLPLRKISEINLLLNTIKGESQFRYRSEVISYEARYLFSIDWKKMSGREIARFWYKILVPLPLRLLYTKAKRGGAELYNYESKNPIFF